MRSFSVFFGDGLKKPLNKQLSCRWFETHWRSCDVTVMWGKRDREEGSQHFVFKLVSETSWNNIFSIGLENMINTDKGQSTKKSWRIFHYAVCSHVSSIVAGCPCGVCCRGLTTPPYGGSICGKAILNKLVGESISMENKNDFIYNANIQLQWLHNERVGVSNHRNLDCSLKRLFRPRSKQTSKLRVTDLFEGNSQVTGEFPTQTASNTANVSI